MNWNGAADFLAMGGYGLYVWGAFGMVALVIGLEVAQLALRRRMLRARDAGGIGTDALHGG